MPEDLILNRTDITLDVSNENTFQLIATILPSDALNKLLKFTSENIKQLLRRTQKINQLSFLGNFETIKSLKASKE